MVIGTKEKEEMDVNYLEKLRKKLSDLCDIGEFIMGLIVVIGIVIALIGLVPEMISFWTNRHQAGSFMDFLEAVSLVVIGIEFAKMLCKPNTSNIIEALIFLIARQMIISHAGATEMLLSVIAICILFSFRRIMLATRPDKHHHVPNILRAMKIAQTEEFQEALEKLEPENKENAKNEASQKEISGNIDDFWTD